MSVDTTHCPGCGQAQPEAWPEAFSGACPRCLGRFALGEPTPIARPPTVGDRIGRIELLEVLGRGGMGVVYRGYHIDLDRELAVKVIAGTAGFADRVARFGREARILAAMDHPHIVRLFDCGIDADREIGYLTMACVDGQSLEARLAGGPLPVALVLSLMSQLCQALAHAHGLGVIHRDIKPANLLVSGQGHLWVTDFGVAALVGEHGELTGSRDVLGTLPYMAPEQLGSAPVDHRADLFAAGVVLYELLTGRRPFVGATPAELIARIQQAAPHDPRQWRRELSGELVAVLFKALEREPRDRYSSALQLQADLQCLVRGLPVAARPVTRATRLARVLVRRWRALLGLALIAALLAAVGLRLRAQAERRRRQTSARLLAAERATVAAQRAQLRAEQAQLAQERARREGLERRQQALAPLMLARHHLRRPQHARLRGVVSELLDQALALDPGLVEARLDLIRVLAYRDRADLIPAQVAALVQHLPAEDRAKIAPVLRPYLHALVMGVKPAAPSLDALQGVRPRLIHPATWRALLVLFLTECRALEQALALVERLLEDPVARTWETGFLKARILQDLRRHDEALAVLVEQLASHPRNIVLLAAKARLAHLSGRRELALRSLRTAFAVDASSHPVWHVLALVRRGELERRQAAGESGGAAAGRVGLLHLELEGYRREPGLTTAHYVVRRLNDLAAAGPDATALGTLERVCADALAGSRPGRRALALVAVALLRLDEVEAEPLERAGVRSVLMAARDRLSRLPWPVWLSALGPPRPDALEDVGVAAAQRWSATRAR